MKKIAILISLVILLPYVLKAQSTMSDQKVFEYVVKQYEMGASQTEIASDLLKKGVDIKQLQRVRNKYGKEYKSLMSSQSKSKIMNEDRSRSNNGESSPQRSNVIDYISDTSELLALMELKKSEDEHSRIFGHDIFRTDELSFEPNMNIATPEDYLLGAGDVVYIEIYGASQQTIEGTITPDGFITISDFGPVALSGLTVKQANARLAQQIGTRYEGSKIKLSVGQTRTIMVNVMGEVETPGTYTLSAFSSVFHALYMAGGVSKIGTLRDIRVYRNNKLVTSVDIYDYILNGQLSGNVQLIDNDVIIVGSYDCLVTIEGKVKRPMKYEMKRTETMAQLLDYAGGFTGDAYTKSVRVMRKTGRDLTVFNVDDSNIGTFTMADQDSVRVDSIIQRYSNAVEVRGAVFRPGLYQLGEKIKTVGQLVRYAEGVTEDAFLAHAVLQRMKADRTLEVEAIDLAGILNGSVKDVALRNEDILLVPSLASVNQSQTLTIHGEVFAPGTYKFASNMTIEDLILQAGGLKESASSVKVDVARRLMDQKATSDSEIRSQTFSFELRDGLVIDGGEHFTLEPYDEVYVRRSPGFSVQENVAVTGEVLFAGTYTLAKQNCRLSDVIKAAGGPTSMANVSGARLERKATPEEKLRMQQSQLMKKNRSQESDTANIRNISVSDTYFVGIDLAKALAKPGCDEDIVLHEGDRIIVPKLINTVRISGEVMYPNTVGFISGEGAGYYISQAGGYSNNARRSRGYIIYQNGKVAKLRRHAKPAPGCEIVIPAKKERNNFAVATQWATISTSLATIVALLITAL